MYQHKQAFTLIELLIVVLIIGILASVALPQYQMVVHKSRMVQLWTIVKSIKNQQELFFLENGYYATDCSELDADIPANNQNYWFNCNNGANYRALGAYVAPDICVTLEVHFDHQPSQANVPGSWLCTSSSNVSETIRKKSEKLCQLIGL